MSSKSVFTVYDNKFDFKFTGDLLGKVKMLDIDDSMLNNLSTMDYDGFMKTGIEYADVVIKEGDDNNKEIESLFDNAKDKRVEVIAEGEDFLESHYKLYNELAV